MGGSDNHNFVIKITKTLSNKIYNKIQFSLLTNRSKVKILKKILKKKNNFKIITRKQKNLYSLANKNKLIISNMGVSMYEFAHANKKIILIPQSKIHKKISSKLKLFKLFKILKSPKDINSKIISDGFKEDNKTVNLRANIYDGFGAKRIVQFFNQKFRNCKLAKIRDFDKYFLYNLVNDPAVRIASIKKGNIPFQNHEKWFRSKFKNKKNIFYLLKYNNLKIGQIRLEKIKKKYLLDYSISNEFRGFGLGSKMIKLAINKIKNSNVIAQSLVKNFYSNYTLQKAGFKRINLKKNIINYQFIR